MKTTMNSISKVALTIGTVLLVLGAYFLSTKQVEIKFAQLSIITGIVGIIVGSLYKQENN